MNKKIIIALTSGLLSASIFTGCSVNPVSGKKDFVLMSEQQEVSLGTGLNKEIIKQYKPYNNPALQAYVNNLGQQLAQRSHRNNIRYHFMVVDDPSVNAFALPGGYIYISRGLMAYLNSEAELAGVLGHEIGHVTARHSARQHSRETVSSLLVSVIGNKYGGKDLLNTVMTASVRGFGRDHELQADRLGAEYLARVGYQPQNMIDVVGVLKDQEEFSKYLARSEGKQPPSYHGLYSTHPSNDKRLQEVIKAADRFPSAGTRGENRSAYLQRIQGMTFDIDKNQKGQIQLITARPGDTFASLAARSPIKKYATERLRLLNGMFPRDEPQAGQVIKVIR